MKKFLLAIGVIGLIGVYAIFQKHQQEENGPLVLPTAIPTSTSGGQGQPSSTVTPTTGSASGYKDGTYTGPVTDAFYGNVQVQVVISGGKITDVKWLQYPTGGGHTDEVSSQVMPVLTQEVIAKQSAAVDSISGATNTTGAFQQSLQQALQQAKS